MKETNEYRATLETSLANKEENVSGFKIPSTARAVQYNHTRRSAELPSPELTAETNGFLNKAVGIAKALQVNDGDRVQLEVYARYTGSINGSTSVIANLASAVTTTLGPAIGESAQAALNGNLNGLIGGIPHNGSVAKAYLAYVLLDNSYVVRKFGFHRISSTAAIQHERLFIDETMPYAGYLYVWVANESNVSGTTSVYFDDLSIIHEKNNAALQVTQASDYYPFGLSFNSYVAGRAGADQNTSYAQNKFQFQEQERQYNFERNGDLDLGWYQFRFRMHDPAIGRFGVVDPLADKYTYNSPYAFSENRLIDGIELEGAEYLSTFDRWQYGDNRLTNAFKVGGNVITDFMNVLPDTWNSGVYTFETIRDHGWSYYFNGLGNELSTMATGIGDYFGRQYNYAINTPASQQWSDTWQAFDKAKSYEAPFSFTLAALTTKNFASNLGRAPLNPGLTSAVKMSSQILSWGKNARGHLIKHADVLGFGGYTPQQLQKMLPQLRGAANLLLNNANPALTRVGQWHGHQNALMYISNGKMLVTEANGTFITVINKTANQWYNAAKPLR